VLGHVQRGGTPTAYDRVLASRLGQHAHLAVRDGRFGTMAALRSSHIEMVPLIEATVPKRVPDEELDLAETFLG
jgi:6-phosphofructokinase 1